MQRRIIFLLLVVGTVLASTTAEAGHRGHGAYGKSNGYHHRTYAHRPKQHHHRHHHGHHKSHRNALHLVTGAVLLGTLVTTVNRPQPAGVVISAPGYAIRQPYSVQQNRWYQRDTYGDCFEVRLQRDGQQVWTQTGSHNCR